MPSPTLPRFLTHEDDVLVTAAVRGITPRFGPLSPPTSGISRLSEEAETMYSLSSGHCHSTTRTLSDDEANIGDDSDPDRPRQRQETEEPEPAFPWEVETTGNKKPARYNVKPPMGPFEETAANTALTNSRSTSVNMSPRPRVSTSTPVKTSRKSTPQSLSKLRSKLASKVPSPLRVVSKASDHDEGASNNREGTAENNLIDDEEEPVITERTLRKRTIQQTHPFKFDKHNFHAQKSGRAVNTKKVEKEVKQEIEGIERRKSGRVSSGTSNQNKRKASTNPKQGAPSKRRSSSVVSRISSPDAEQHKPVFDPAKATLLVRLDGFPDAAAAISLKRCNHIDKLMNFIAANWEWKYNGADFSHAIVSFPWLTAKSNLLLRTGSETSFERVLTEAQRAPMWADGGTCDIDMTVYVQ